MHEHVFWEDNMEVWELLSCILTHPSAGGKKQKQKRFEGIFSSFFGHTTRYLRLPIFPIGSLASTNANGGRPQCIISKLNKNIYRNTLTIDSWQPGIAEAAPRIPPREKHRGRTNFFGGSTPPTSPSRGERKAAPPLAPRASSRQSRPRS